MAGLLEIAQLQNEGLQSCAEVLHTVRQSADLALDEPDDMQESWTRTGLTDALQPVKFEFKILCASKLCISD